MIVFPLKQAALIYVLLSFFSLSAAEKSINFNRDIRPILSNKCFHCHGPDEEDRKEDLRLDVAGGKLGALTPRDDYHIIKPGEPEESELWYRVTSEYEDEFMPPADSHKAPLTEDEIERITQWIKEGGEYQDFWAFIPPETPDSPRVDNRKWSQNAIDSIVYASLNEKGLKPKGEADKRTLIRRLSFDLTGLPPSIQEIDTFLKDRSSNAYEKLVDRLLAYPAYGEHMARYWADLVRLGDTNGMHKDFHREFSTYRDWLIRSFNENLPYDDFISYQLAGDEYESPSRDHLIASGFNRLHMIIDKGTALPEESLHKNVVDRVEAFGTAFLGLTVQCAQCHDHKYDPITQKDYFQLYAFFNNFAGNPETVREPERGLQPPYINLTTPKQDLKLAEFEARMHDAKIRRDAVIRQEDLSDKWPDSFEKVSVPFIGTDSKAKPSETVFKSQFTLDSNPDAALVRFLAQSEVELFANGNFVGKVFPNEQGAAAEISEHLRIGENTITAIVSGPKNGLALQLDYTIGGTEKTLSTGADWLTKGSEGSSWAPVAVLPEESDNDEWTVKARSVASLEIDREIARIESERAAFLEDVPAAMVMAERTPARETHILIGGSYDAPGEPVQRNTPGFLPALGKQKDHYTRKDLADWLVMPEHPLTARVAVNRFWQYIFGVGLVKTSEDFGAQGEWPSHPELLDLLSTSFVESGWNVKELLRRIVLSNTYRQRSDATTEEYRKDPDNRHLSRGSRYRLDAEEIRDQILAISGQLNREMFGKSVKPPQPPGLWEMVSMAAPFTYVPDAGKDIYRRSLYTYWRRGMPPPQMTIMNAPSREFCVSRRERTNTSLQALLLMNEEEYFNAAKETAKIVMEKRNETNGRLSLAYEMITSHLPHPERLNLMRETLSDFHTAYQGDPELTRSLTPEWANAPMDQRVDLASWTMMTHSLFNLEIAKVRR